MRVVAGKVGGVQELAKVTGISESQLYRIVGGENEAKVGALASIATAGGVSVEWLVMGDAAADHAESLGGSFRVAEPAAGYANIPLYDVRARAGNNGTHVDGEKQVNELAFREDWIRRELRVSPKDLRLIHVEGDSMEPDLRSGDIILVDHTDTAARREGVYVIRMDNALLVKALQRLPGGVIKVTSRNSAYVPFNVNASDVESSDDFSIIGRVVWACRRF